LDKWSLWRTSNRSSHKRHGRGERGRQGSERGRGRRRYRHTLLHRGRAFIDRWEIPITVPVRLRNRCQPALIHLSLLTWNVVVKCDGFDFCDGFNFLKRTERICLWGPSHYSFALGFLELYAPKIKSWNWVSFSMEPYTGSVSPVRDIIDETNKNK
jgi:hypothetical protein